MPLCLCWTPTPPGSDGDILGSSFKFFVSYLDAAEKLKPKERGEFLYAVAKFGITGEEIPLRKSLQPLWDVIKPNLEVSRKYQTYGEKGGRPKKPPFEKSESPLSENRKPNKKEDMEKDMDVEKNTNMEYSAADAASEVATQQGRQGVFAQFSGEDSALLQALQDYDLMRQEKHKELTDTMRRSLCRQLDEEFHRCEWVEIIKQATMRGWLRFYPLDEPKPHQRQQRQPTAEEEYTRLFNEVCGGGTP